MFRLSKPIVAATAGTAVLTLAMLPAAAGAQVMQSCAPQETLAQQLDREYGETVTAQGVDASGNLVQIYSSQTGTWTIAVTLPGGPSCVVSSGEGWDDSQIAEVPDPSRGPGYAS